MTSPPGVKSRWRFVIVSENHIKMLEMSCKDENATVIYLIQCHGQLNGKAIKFKDRSSHAVVLRNYTTSA